jgi:hypothetical protein
MEAPKTLQQAIQFFSDFENCRRFMISVRWEDGVVRSPTCNSDKVTYLANAKVYRCYGNHPKQKFSLKVGTIFEDSPLPLERWLPAVRLIAGAKNGISSYEIHRALGVTQKSAWFMMHRIRLAMQTNSFVKVGGNGSEVEVDETFIGGKARNMHKDKRAKAITGTGGSGKAIVFSTLLVLDVNSNMVKLSNRSIEEQSFWQCASLVAQSDHGVDAHSSPRWDRARGQRDQHQQEANARKGGEIVRTPMTAPASASTSPRRTTSRISSRLCAPSAMRIPSSRVRLATSY